MSLLTIPERYRRQFQDRMVPEIQQTNQLLANTYTVDPSWTGKEKIFEDLSAVEFQEVTGRHQDTNPQEILGLNRKGVKRAFQIAHLFGRRDEAWLASLSLPQNEVIEGYRYAWNRKLDELTMAAATATVFGGTDADNFSTEITFPADNTIAVDSVLTGSPASTGITLDKLWAVVRQARKDKINLAMEPLTLAIGPEEEMSLVKELKSQEGNEEWGKLISMWLEDRSRPLLGYFHVVVTDYLSETSNIATVIAYTKRAFVMSPVTMNSDITVRTDKSYSVQLFADGEIGITRRYDKGVYRILCDRTGL